MPDRSIRNIPVSSRRRPSSNDPEFVHGQGGYRMPPPPLPLHSRPRTHYLRWGILAVLVFGALGAGLSLLFTGATITIVPRSTTVNPSGAISAESLGTDQSAGSQSGSTLPFQRIDAAASTTRSVAASGTKNVTASAQGTITIFNKFSESPQTLIGTTRFESPVGRIYRIHDTVVVPGGKKKADGTLTPGSVSATLYADQPGPEYNTGAVQFSIPGFKGKPQYNDFYATTAGISGGVSGAQPSVKPEDAAKAKADMQAELKTSLMDALQAEVPEGYVLIPGALDLTYGDVIAEPGTGGNATLKEAAIVSAPAIKTSDLAKSIATGAVDGYNGEALDFADPTAIPLVLSQDTPYAESATTLSLTLSQPVTLMWQVDTAAIASAVAGKHKSDFESIMKTFKPAVASASAALRPFWLINFPSDTSKIKVKIRSVI